MGHQVNLCGDVNCHARQRICAFQTQSLAKSWNRRHHHQVTGAGHQEICDYGFPYQPASSVQLPTKNARHVRKRKYGCEGKNLEAQTLELLNKDTKPAINIFNEPVIAVSKEPKEVALLTK